MKEAIGGYLFLCLIKQISKEEQQNLPISTPHKHISSAVIKHMMKQGSFSVHI